MSKNGESDVSEFDPLNGQPVTEGEKKAEAEYLNRIPPSTLPQAKDTIFTSVNSSNKPPSLPTSSLNALSENISNDGQNLDPITEAIRREILRKQRDVLREYFIEKKIESELIVQPLKIEGDRQLTPEELAAEEEKDKKFREFLSNSDNRQLINRAFEDPSTKKKLEEIEITGYRNIHNTYSAANYKGGFQPVSWEKKTDTNRSTVVKNGADEEICTLNETTHTNPTITVNQGDRQVTINSYRTIDFPTKLEGKSGTMHLSMLALDENGGRPPANQSIYFTAHYEETPPTGEPKLKEVSSPQPIKFFGEGDDAVGYVEHGGKIYTMPVTRGKYQEMMKEVERNKGQSVDISQTLAEDKFKVQEQGQNVNSNEPKINDPASERSTEHKNTEIPKPLENSQEVKSELQTTSTPPQYSSSSELPKTNQPQHSQPFENKSLVKAATELSQALKDLLEQFNEKLKNIKDQANLINENTKEAAEKILQDKEADFSQKQAGINALSENILNNKDLTPASKVQGVGTILKAISDNDLSPSQKANLLKGIVANIFKGNNLEKDQRQQILERVTENALKIGDEGERRQVIDNITQSVLDSDLKKDEKGSIIAAVANKINASGLDSQGKNQLLSDVLDKGKEVLSEDQQRQIQQNLDANSRDKGTTVSMQNFANNLEKAANANERANLIKDETSKALQNGNAQEGIGDLTQKVLESSPTLEQKLAGTGVIIDTVKNSKIADEVKAGAYVDTSKAILGHKDFSDEQKQTGVEKAVDAALGLENQANIKNAINGITEEVLNSDLAPKAKAGTLEKTTTQVAESTLKIENKADIAQGVGETIAKHKTDLPEKQTYIESAEKGIANSNAVIEQKQKMTEGFVNGIFDGTADKDVQLKLTSAAIKGVKESTAKGEDEEALVKAAKDVALNREQQNDKTLHPAHNIRNVLSGLRSIKTTNAEREKQSEQQVKNLVEEFNKVASTEEKINFIQTKLVDDKTLSPDARTKVTEKLVQEQADKRGENKGNIIAVETQEGSKKLQNVGDERERTGSTYKTEDVNTEYNVAIMKKLMEAKSNIRLEDPSKRFTQSAKVVKSPPYRG